MSIANRRGSGKQKSADVERKIVTLIYPYTNVGEDCNNLAICQNEGSIPASCVSHRFCGKISKCLFGKAHNTIFIHFSDLLARDDFGTLAQDLRQSSGVNLIKTFFLRH